MSLRPVDIPPFHRPGESGPAPARVRFRLLDAAGGDLLGLRIDGEPVTGDEIVHVTDQTVRIRLTPTTEIPGAVYAVQVTVGRVSEAFRITFGPSETPLTWAEIVAGLPPMQAQDVSALTLHMADDTRHLPPAEGQTPGAALVLDAGGTPAWTPAPPGSGDMQSLIYDPRGVAADAFLADNLTGRLDGGTF